jgi:hypothetical protein
MIYKLQAQSGFRRDSMWCGPAAHAVMPSPAERIERGACTFFGGVPITRSPYGVQGAARCELIPRLHLAAVIEGHAGDILGCSDLSRSSTLSGQHIPNKNAVNSASGGMATDRSGKTICHALILVFGAEKVLQNRPRQNKGAASLTKAHGAFRKIGEAVNRQGTLTITGSNVRLGTEMPVALSLFP